MSIFGFQDKTPKWKLNNITDEDLSQFGLAVRKKEGWQTKILNEKIALKWVIEAELADPNSQVLAGRALEAVSELRRSAVAIRMLDCDMISLTAAGTSTTDSSLEHFDLNSIDDNLKKSLKYARGSKYALREPELRESGLGVYVSDDLVPQALHQELIRQLDALAAKEPRDFHPGSFGKVQDLIHPSLYPYIAGITPVSSSNVKLPPFGNENKFHTQLHTQYSQNMISSSVFRISPDGTDAHIESYINGLGTREQYPGLFRVIEQMFLLALPHFEKTLRTSYEYRAEYSPSVRRWVERREFSVEYEGALTRQMWTQFLHEHSSEWEGQKRDEKDEKEGLRRDIIQEDHIKTTFYDLGDEFGASNQYKGKEMKVIVKAANHILKPGQEYEGSWHMEGMPHEKILASVIYYYDTDSPIEDRGLSFRKFRDSDEDFPPLEDHDYTHETFSLTFSADNGDDDGDEYHYPSDWEMELQDGELVPISTTSLPSFIELGTVPTTNICPGGNGTGRMLSFPNWLQHKVSRVNNGSTSGHCAASRKILCFFLVDDSLPSDIHYHGFNLRIPKNMNVLTTSEVPMQMRRCNEPTMFALISAISFRLTRGTALPPELLAIIWQYASEGTLTREEAEVHRLSLMNDRKVSNRTVNPYGNYYTLCEH